MLNRLIAKILYGLFVLEVVGGIIVALLAFFVRSCGSDGRCFDGLGRQLQEKSLMLRFGFSDRLWAKWSSALIELVVFFDACALNYALVKLAERVKASKP